MKFSEIENLDEAISGEERKLKSEMAKLGLGSKHFEVHDGKITVLMGFNVKYKPEMAYDENFVKNGKLVHQWDLVGGNFIIRNLGLTTLENCPEQVQENFDCGVNHLTSLEHCPKTVLGDFAFTQNRIADFSDLPQLIEEVRQGFYFSEKPVKKGAIYLLQVKGISDISDHLPQFKVIAKYLGKPDAIFDCQQELIESGFEEYAE